MFVFYSAVEIVACVLAVVNIVNDKELAVVGCFVLAIYAHLKAVDARRAK